MNGSAGTASAIAAGDYHSCAVRAGTGAVVCWGSNYFGEATPPPSVDGSAGSATAIAAGDDHSCAIRAGTGAVVCWGSNYFGEATPPASVNGTSGTASAIAASDYRSCAIRAGTGVVFCWGALGNGQATLPPPVDGTTGTASAIAAGSHSPDVEDSRSLRRPHCTTSNRGQMSSKVSTRDLSEARPSYGEATVRATSLTISSFRSGTSAALIGRSPTLSWSHTTATRRRDGRFRRSPGIEVCASSSRPFPMPKIAQAYGDRKLVKALGNTKFDGVPIRVIGLPQARNSAPYDGRPACRGNKNCIPICPIQAKCDATVHVRKAIKNKAVLIAQAVVTELGVDANGSVNAVVYKTWDGQTHTVAGRIVVLAANAIESAKILQLSNGGNGIANSSGQVGRNLMDHIGGEGAALMPFAAFPFRGPQSTSCIEGFRDHKHRKKFAAFRLTIGNDGWGRTKHPFQNLKELTGGDLTDPAAKRLFSAELQAELRKIVTHQMRIAYSVEQLPDAGNRVFPSKTEKDDLGIPKPQIECQLDDYTFGGAAYAQRVIKHIFTTIGASEETWDFSDLQSRAYSGSGHIMGTLRMARDAKSGVVDSDCRSFDHQNLFVAGASVFATSAPVNPTITVAAIALRTATAIEQELAQS